METAVSLLSDLSILIFDLSLYMKLTALKKENTLYRTVMYCGVFLITAAYIIAAYVFHIPYGTASFLCMSIPSFLMFFCLSRYKNARFLVTFCFVDTISLILAALGKTALVLGGKYGGIISCILLFALCITAFLLLRPCFPRYRALMEQVTKGWWPMAISTAFIYLLLVFFAGYPAPLITRLEYLPVFYLLCVTVLSFYGVFIMMLLQKSRLIKANQLLKQQKHWHDLAYLDELTQLGNNAAYSARTAEMEKEASSEIPCAVMLFDIDNFKKVNDTHGHLYGNTVLRKTADFFCASFPREYYEFFRIGGDEFIAISTGISQEQIVEKVNWINAMTAEEGPGCACSCGYAMVDFTRQQAFYQAFRQADAAMYAVKTEKKRRARTLISR